MNGVQNATVRALCGAALLGLAAMGPSTASAQTILIQGGQVHTGTGTVIQDGAVLLVDGVIAAVGERANVTVPEGATVVDAAGKWVTPGLIDPHTGLGVLEIGLEQNTVDRSVSHERITAAFRLEDALNPNSTLIPVTRVEGVTRVVVAPQSFQGLILGQGLVANLAPGSASEMVDHAPAAVYVQLGEAGASASGGSRGAALLLLREALQDARDYASNREAYMANRRRDYALSRLDLDALVPVVRGRVPLVVAAQRASDIRAALRLRDEFRLQMILAGAQEGWMVADELAAANVPVIVTSLINLPGFETLGTTYENPARLHDAGVQVLLSSFDAHNVRNLRQVAGQAVAFGMPWEEALRAATATPAATFGVGDRVGALAPGLEADVVVWSGDPFELTTWAERVYIKGREIPQESRQRALFERYRTLEGLPPGG